jgi:phosphoenolpyruvate synthase/pyruvate phosphate dikinase
MSYTISFAQLNQNSIPEAGGKGANWGELINAGLLVPAGFVLITEAYGSSQKVLGQPVDFRAIAYRLRQGNDPATVSLAVVVQQLIPADAAGILFTADPTTGERDHLLINATWGLGKAIVGGRVTPDTIVIDKSDWCMLSRETAVLTP